jgi:hypothetical protein
MTGTESLVSKDNVQTIYLNQNPNPHPELDIHDCVKSALQDCNGWDHKNALREKVEVHINWLQSNPEYSIVPKNELGALVYYTSQNPNHVHSLYYILNDALRNNNEPILEKFQDFLWYAFQALEYLPRYSGTTYRRTELPLKQLEEEYSIGSEIVFSAFTSSTKKFSSLLSVEVKGTCMIFNNTHSGIDLSNISLYPEEEEVLFFPGSSFIVKGIHSKHGIDYIEFAENGIDRSPTLSLSRPLPISPTLSLSRPLPISQTLARSRPVPESQTLARSVPTAYNRFQIDRF